MLNQDQLKSLYEYKDGALYWKIARNNKVKIGDFVGGLDLSINRFVVGLDSKKHLRSRLIFLYHKGYLPKCVDHRDRNQLNDRIENLRPSTKAQNCQNSTSAKNSTSVYLGVHLDKQKYIMANGDIKIYKKWKASIIIDGKVVNLGRFINEIDAAKAYNNAALSHHGEFSNLNVF